MSENQNRPAAGRVSPGALNVSDLRAETNLEASEPNAARAVVTGLSGTMDLGPVSDVNFGEARAPVTAWDQVDELRRKGVPDDQIITALTNRVEVQRAQAVAKSKQFEDRATAQHEKMMALEVELKTKTQEYADLASVMEASCARQNSIIDTLVAELENRRTQYDEIKEYADDQERQAEALSDYNQRAKAEIEKLRNLLRMKNNEIGRISEDHNRTVMDYQNQINALTARLGRQEAQIIQLTTREAERVAQQHQPSRYQLTQDSNEIRRQQQEGGA